MTQPQLNQKSTTTIDELRADLKEILRQAIDDLPADELAAIVSKCDRVIDQKCDQALAHLHGRHT